MRVIRWKNSATGVESLNITATGIYFPVGKTDSSFKLKLSMTAGGQTASVDTVRDSSGSRTGYGAMNVSGTTETKLGAVVSFATGIIVTAISGTLNAILDDEIPITNFPEMGLGRFPTKEDADAYVYGAAVPQGLPAIISGTQRTYGGAGVGWVAQGSLTSTPRKICGFGNSYVAFGGGVSSYAFGSAVSFRGFVTCGVALLGGRATFNNNLGWGGATSHDCLERINDVVADDSDIVVFMEVSNDIQGGLLALDVISNYREIASKIAASGKLPVICTGIPYSVGRFNESMIAQYAELNSLIRGIPGAVIFDIIANPIVANPDGSAKSGILAADNLHLSMLGGSLIGGMLRDLLSDYIPNEVKYPIHDWEMSGNLALNGLFTGSGTSTPTSWSSALSNGHTFSYVKRDVPRHNTDVTLKAVVAANGNVRLSQTISEFPNNVRLRAKLRLSVNDVAQNTTTPQQLTFTILDQSSNTLATGNTAADSGGTLCSGDVLLESGLFVAPNSATGLILRIDVYGGATYKFDRFWISQV